MYVIMSKKAKEHPMKGIKKKAPKSASHKMTRSEKAANKASGVNRQKRFLTIGAVALAACILLGLGGFLL